MFSGHASREEERPDESGQWGGVNHEGNHAALSSGNSNRVSDISGYRSTIFRAIFFDTWLVPLLIKEIKLSEQPSILAAFAALPAFCTNSSNSVFIVRTLQFVMFQVKQFALLFVMYLVLYLLILISLTKWG